MTVHNQKIHTIILVFLVMLPAFFPFAHREHYLIPYNVLDETGLITLLCVVYFLISLPYWYIVGIVFARWVNQFAKSFLLANLPVFANAVSEIIYYGIFHMKQGAYPLVEYLLGSHIDKFNPGITDPIVPGILLSTACFLLFFTLGYAPQKREKKR